MWSSILLRVCNERLSSALALEERNGEYCICVAICSDWLVGCNWTRKLIMGVWSGCLFRCIWLHPVSPCEQRKRCAAWSSVVALLYLSLVQPRDTIIKSRTAKERGMQPPLCKILYSLYKSECILPLWLTLPPPHYFSVHSDQLSPQCVALYLSFNVCHCMWYTLLVVAFTAILWAVRCIERKMLAACDV